MNYARYIRLHLDFVFGSAQYDMKIRAALAFVESGALHCVILTEVRVCGRSGKISFTKTRRSSNEYYSADDEREIFPRAPFSRLVKMTQGCARRR